MRYHCITLAACAAAVTVLNACAGPGTTTPALAHVEGVAHADAMVTSSNRVAGAGVWVSDYSGNTVSQYQAGVTDPKRLSTLTAKWPIDIATDSSGNLYVLDAPPAAKTSSFSEYPPGAATPSTVTKVAAQCSQIQAGPNGTVYVTCTAGSAVLVHEYFAGATEPSLTIRPAASYGLGYAVVGRDNTFYDQWIGGAHDITYSFAEGSTTPHEVKNAGVLGAMILDNNDNLVMNTYYTKPREEVMRVVPLGGGPISNFEATQYAHMAYDAHDGYIYGVVLKNGGLQVQILDYATHAVVGTISGFKEAEGIAISPNPY